jgi:hypothetical protein
MVEKIIGEAVGMNRSTLLVVRERNESLLSTHTHTRVGQGPETFGTRDRMPNSRLPADGADERETTGVAAVRAQEPVVEAEEPVVRPEAERVRRLPPLVGRGIEARRVPVESENVGVGDHCRRDVDSTRECVARRERQDLFTIRRNPEALKGGREIQQDDRTRGHEGEQLLVPSIRHNRHLAGEISLAVVLEGTTRVLPAVGPLDGREEGTFESGTIVGDSELRQHNRETDATKQVCKLLVAADLPEQLLRTVAELSFRQEHGSRRERLLQTTQTRDVVNLRLDEPEVTVGIDDLALDPLERDQPTVLVSELDRRILEYDREIATPNGLEHLVPVLFSAFGGVELVEGCLGLNLGFPTQQLLHHFD